MQLLDAIPEPTAQSLPLPDVHQHSRTGLLIAFDAALTDDQGEVSSATRFALVRLFHALGGAVAVFSARDLRTLDRRLGLADMPLIASNGREVRAAHDLPLPMDRPLAALLDMPPFANRALLVCGASAADQAVLQAVDSRGGQVASGACVRTFIDDWLQRLAPLHPHARAHA